MRDIIRLEKDLNKEIRKLVIGEKVDKEKLLSDLQLFFKNKKQEDIDKINPLNIRLFTVVLEILRDNKKLSPVHLANIDYVYSYKNKGLKYYWKSSEFNLSKDVDKINSVINRIINITKLDNKKAEKINGFLEQAIEMYNQKYSADMEETGIINKNKDTYIHLEYHVFDDEYRNERNGEFNVLLVAPNPEIINILPKNNGTTYSNLIFKEV